MVNYTSQLDISDFLTSEQQFITEQVTTKLQVEDKRYVVDSEVSLNLEISKLDQGSVSVHFKVKFPLKLTCDRCLTEFDHKIDLEFDQIYSLQPESGEEAIKNNQIDIKDVLIQEIIADIPMKSICKQSCKGLCQVCGQDLNIKECDCDKVPAGHPEFQKLKKLKK
jgi:uncharacterized protein